MANAEAEDLFASQEAAVTVDPETSRILRQRMESARMGRLVSKDEARERIRQWLSASNSTKTR